MLIIVSYVCTYTHITHVYCNIYIYTIILYNNDTYDIHDTYDMHISMTAGDGDKPQKLRAFFDGNPWRSSQNSASSNVALGHELASRFLGGFFQLRK